ncbi:di-heme oxidoredictase family protein [Alloprevotella tannerae]|uniref:di-heme oxidoredictase family protein n=1 Tax=Alloprevotella tannerae TaxID=76122 RepID=UPI0025FAE703|nr:di-heme oxidoredictase family protein [Alloprevotella tannerae]
MNNHNLMYRTILASAVAMSFVACSDDPIVKPQEKEGEANEVFSAAEWKPGGELGTTSHEEGCYSNPSPFVEQNGLYQTFKHGETFFEKDFTLNTPPRKGLGPAWVRSGCLFCHPGYGHGRRQETYLANTMGNGYLLVIYHDKDGVDGNGQAYKKNQYITEVTGMPQTKAMKPFLPPVDEAQISITWKHKQDSHGNKFPDGETYDLIYPDVKIPVTAFNTNPKPKDYAVRLESTIGIYGTALLDAIDDDSLKAQYAKEAQHAQLNPAMWDAAANDWAATAWYNLADGTKRIKRFTYALTRGSLQDGPGANAMWNITNVTRSDRHYLYTTKAWAKAMSENQDVINYIQQNGRDVASMLHPYYADGSRDSISYLVNLLLGLNKPSDKATYEKYFVKPYGEEMTDKDYYDFMVWHRGLSVPGARNLYDPAVKRGKQLFYEMGCTACHRPSWKTGEDNYYTDAITRGQGALPRYAHQTIWPYTDMIQHRLYMDNDIRADWCRTTPLWGRGLSYQETGAHDRLHDCRARTVIEAIMWHGVSDKSEAKWAADKFYKLKKSDRDAVVAFIDAI